MIRRIVKMSFKPEGVEHFKTIFKTNSHHIKNFEGCSHVELLQDTSNPSLFFTYSLWQSQAHLDNYRNSDLFARVWGATKQMFNDKPQAWTVNEVAF